MQEENSIMRNFILPMVALVLVSFVSCGDANIDVNEGKTEKEVHMDSLDVAEVVTDDFDTTGVPLYYVPEEYTENSEKKIYSTTNGEVGVSIVKYCQTKEGGIEVNYQLKSGAKFRILYRDWAGRILVSKGDSIVNNFSFDKKDYKHLKEEPYWEDKVLQDFWLMKMDTNNESVVAQFSVTSPSDKDKAEFEGLTIQVELDSTGNVSLVELP